MVPCGERDFFHRLAPDGFECNINVLSAFFGFGERVDFEFGLPGIFFQKPAEIFRRVRNRERNADAGHTFRDGYRQPFVFEIHGIIPSVPPRLTAVKRDRRALVVKRVSVGTLKRDSFPLCSENIEPPIKPPFLSVAQLRAESDSRILNRNNLGIPALNGGIYFNFAKPDRRKKPESQTRNKNIFHRLTIFIEPPKVNRFN